VFKQRFQTLSAPASGGGVDAGEHLAQFLELGQRDAEAFDDGRRDVECPGAQSVPVTGELDVGRALVGGASGARDEADRLQALSIGDNVAESNCNAEAICLTERGDRSAAAVSRGPRGPA
jgi:hypothetical protein